MKTKLALFLALCLPACAQFNFFNALSTWKSADTNFNPANYGTVIVWYAARKESYSNGASVGTVTDWSGGGHNATQTNSSAKPTFQTNVVGGQSVFRFNGTTNFLNATFTSADPMTAFIVWKSANPTKYSQSILYGDSAQGNIYGSGGISTSGATLYSGSWLEVPFDTSSFVVMTCRQTSGTENSFINVNGLTSGTGTIGSGVSSSWVIGDIYDHSVDEFLQGDIAEIILYNGQIDNSGTMQAIEDALGAIYGITIMH